MDLIDLLNQDNITISDRPDTPDRANYACFACGGYDRLVVWKNEGRYNAGKYWCNQCRISGDIVTYLMEFRNYSYPDVLEFLQGKPVNPSSIFPAKEREVVEYNYKWARSSLDFVIQCNKRLNNDSTIHETLFHDRGITLETANKFMLGWNHTDQYVKRKKWNLPPKYNEDDSEKKMVLPAGLAIPHHHSGTISSLRIRRKYDIEKYGKYHFVGATDLEPLCIKKDILRCSANAIITEGELDAIRIAQEFPNENDIDIIGMESASGGIPRASMTYRSLFQYEVIALCFDNDEAGKIAAEQLQRFLPNAYYVPVPKKYDTDVTEAFQNGLEPAVWKEYVNHRIDTLRASI